MKGVPGRDITGQKFNRLTAETYVSAGYWLCRCECGNAVRTDFRSLSLGKTKSCGCFKRDRLTKHGKHGSPTYITWKEMRNRCGKDKDYLDVTVCARWDDYINFLADMGEKPEGLTIDRIDSSKPYQPDNCRWADQTIQCLNRRKFKGSKLSTIGVTMRGGRFVANMSAYGVKNYLGSFPNEEMAALAREVAMDRFKRLGFVKYQFTQ